MKETGLFDGPQPDPDKDKAKARRSDPQTSHDAAKKVTKISETQAAILRILDAVRGGMTNDDLCARYEHWRSIYPKDFPPQSRQSIRSRRAALVKMGMVEDSGERDTLPSGNASIKWRLVR